MAIINFVNIHVYVVRTLFPPSKPAVCTYCDDHSSHVSFTLGLCCLGAQTLRKIFIRLDFNDRVPPIL